MTDNLITSSLFRFHNKFWKFDVNSCQYPLTIWECKVGFHELAITTRFTIYNLYKFLTRLWSQKHAQHVKSKSMCSTSYKYSRLFLNS